MRALFSVRPYYGHFHPMVGLARQFRSDGDNVLFATAPRFGQIIESAGFERAVAGLDIGTGGSGYQYGRPVVQAKLDDLLKVVPTWAPDVIVRDPTDFAAALAAEILGVPVVTFGFSLYIGPWQWRDLVGPALADLRALHGLAPDPSLDRLHPRMYLDSVPPWFQTNRHAPATVLKHVRPVVDDGHDPAKPPIPGRRPVIYVTFGTVYNRVPSLFRLVVNALAREPVTILCSVGPGRDPSALFPDPPGNLYAVRYVSHAGLLPACAAVVCHGGFNTVIGAIAHGVPLVNLPLGSDQHANAARCTELGVGLTLAHESVTPADVRSAVAEVMDNLEIRTAAERYRALIAAMPSLSCASEEIRSLRRREFTVQAPSGARE